MKRAFTHSATLLTCLVVSTATWAGDELKFKAGLSDAQEVPVGASTSSGTGEIKVKFDEGLTEVRIDLRVRDLAAAPTAAHFHCNRPGENGPVAFSIVGPLAFDAKGKAGGTLTNADLTGAPNACVTPIGRRVNNIAALAFAMRDGLIYVNVHTPAFPGGEIRGQLLPD